ncbi:MAG: HEAT repeat domain-containing protein, partial [Verrucomicrobiota bacterium]
NAVDEILQQLRPNFIRMIEDTDGDGKFDKSTIFADKLVLPNGALWHNGSLYVAEPPGIWRFTDTNSDGVADKREHIAGKVISNGMSASLHGPVLDPTGKLFWCGGQSGYDLLDKDSELKKGRRAPGVFTLHDDGSNHEIFALGGLANPVEVAFSPEGDVFGTVAILNKIDGQRRDGFMHWIYGGIYNLNGSDPVTIPRTGDPLPPLIHLGQVAPAGIVSYSGSQFGNEFKNNIFFAEFNTHQVIRAKLTRSGSTFRAESEPFLTADDIDFHATDVIEDADGSLLIVNTGGWFRHGCPTSQIAKPEVKGAIYRIRRKGAAVVNDPRGLNLDWAKTSSEAVSKLLSDARPAVAERAVVELAQRINSLPSLKMVLQKSENANARRNAVWALSRIGTDAAQKILRLALNDKNNSVRQSAVYAVGMNRDKNATDILQSIVAQDSEPAIRREAAAALGRIGNPKSVPALLAALDGKNDAFLTHSIIYALIQINNPTATKQGLAAEKSPVQRGALIALEQMPGSELSRKEIVPLLGAKNFDVQKTAFTIAGRRKDLTAEMFQTFKSWLDQPKLSDEQKEFIQTALTGKSLEPGIERAVAEKLSDAETSAPIQQLLLEVVAKSAQKELPANWVASVGKVLQHGSAELRLQAIEVVQQRDIKKLDASLQQLADDKSSSVSLRIAALAALAPRLENVSESHVALLKESLRAQSSPVLRLASARTISSLQLSDKQIIRLAEFLPEVDPLALPSVLRSFGRKTNDAVGLALVAGLEKAPSAQNLGAGEVARLVSNYSSVVQEKAKPLLAKLGADLEKQKQRLSELSAKISNGDFKHGKEVFFGKKASCFTCHRISGQGGMVGPNLSKIGGIRTGHDLLESVVFPSSSIVQGYHPFNLETTDGEDYSGIIIRETPEAVWIRGTDLAENRVETKKIKNMRESTVSVMPQGLDANLSSQELSDLIAYLQSLK